ncbi:L,D-transpeptidase [Conexibacter sp. JD483]|uniref:L,D-transpeptidase n=1 Tax=unclassified Conexibacter TaxID=2627773 RepID=UPI00272759F1|nr:MULTISPECIES: L,D-transpeptidase [unclassified Conexibacter]MDO8188942.1 L,D-transpeptidase [Conexibacter sp. CPCC 205706]MDO8201743.1 L,D-transpeptidase [Conexibacter sp. CPCC 205762]MDR9371426.1 L,D-transpeptidase [Conexibacter sp. JD483]
MERRFAAFAMFVRIAVAAMLLVAVAGGSATAAAPSASPHARVTRLSNETTDSRWAYPARVATVRAQPSVGAGAIGRTRLLTEMGSPNVYLVLALAQRHENGQRWLQVRLPGRPNGRTGWVLRGALGPLHATTTQLVVDRARLTATLYRSGRPQLRTRVGIGAPATPTPPGRYVVREKLRFHAQPLYGSYALGTSAFAPTLTEWPAGGVVGIHGTDEPWLIPGRPSHGCVRVRNDEMARLWAATPLGTPLLIR